MAYIRDNHFHAIVRQINEWVKAGMIDSACALALIDTLNREHLSRDH